MANTHSIRTGKNPSRPKSGRRKRAEAPNPPDLNAILGSFYDILGRFCYARSFLECGMRLVDHWCESSDRPSPGDEAVCLRHGLDLFIAAYRQLDEAVTSSQQAAALVKGSRAKKGK
jgi:hypothetical protein